MVIVMDEETYLATNGASRLGIGDAGLHRNNSGVSAISHKRNVENQLEKDRLLIVRRDALRLEYHEKVKKGLIRPPNRKEVVIRTANGHPDNPSVQASRRIAEKNGWDWKSLH